MQKVKRSLDSEVLMQVAFNISFAFKHDNPGNFEIQKKFLCLKVFI